MKKSRFFYLSEEVNQNKVAALEALQVEYTAYLKECVGVLLRARRFDIPRGAERRLFFPLSERLSSQIAKNAQGHAIEIVSGWAASKYAVKLRSYIKTLYAARLIDENMRAALYITGKRVLDQPSGKVTQNVIDLYWSLLLEPSICGRPPSVSIRSGMRMSEMTAVLAVSTNTSLTSWWLGFSHLGAGKRIQLPLKANPFVPRVTDVSKGILARREASGRWRFEVVEKKECVIPAPAKDAPRVGVDVGLNVMAATSNGDLLGVGIKPKFNQSYKVLQAVRANRQRQGLYENSPRLDRLEAKLSGTVKTLAGEVSNKLIRQHPHAVFVVEDLDLKGCKGQKRFAYRALHHALSVKAPCIVVNPAYTSQTCPSCGYVARGNRSGIEFRCRSCGREGHADVVGAKNLLGRSEDKQVSCDDHPSDVKALLRTRYLHKRSSVSRGLSEKAPAPSGPKLTTGGPRKRRRHSFKEVGTCARLEPERMDHSCGTKGTALGRLSNLNTVPFQDHLNGRG